jgi:hypothetical protein
MITTIYEPGESPPEGDGLDGLRQQCTVIQYSHDDEPGYLASKGAARLLLLRGIHALPDEETTKKVRRSKANPSGFIHGPWGVEVLRPRGGRRIGSERALFVLAGDKTPASLAMEMLARVTEARKADPLIGTWPREFPPTKAAIARKAQSDAWGAGFGAGARGETPGHKYDGTPLEGVYRRGFWEGRKRGRIAR